jgi:hypothetical protein
VLFRFKDPITGPMRFDETWFESRQPCWLAAAGKSLELEVAVEGASRKFKVNIRSGVENGGRLRLKGEGHPGKKGGPPGDMFLLVAIQ